MRSAIYEGTVRHRRLAERSHQFRYSIAMPYLDLDEIEEVVGGRLAREGPGVLRFRRADYLGSPDVPLKDAVHALVASRLGAAPTGPVRLLTHLRTAGCCFNPASLYYCFGPDGEQLEAIVLEVTNTPWGERHAYVLPCREPESSGSTHNGAFDKAFHVSPFMGMDQRYTWRAGTPGLTLSVHIESTEGDVRVFDATLRLRRRPLDRRTLAGMTIRYPFAAQRMLVLIYAHAVCLSLKGVRIRPHP